MDRILLFSIDSDDIKVTIEAYFDENDSLVIEGYDIGKRVEEYWGDSDYEYSTTVHKEEIGKLYELFGLPKGSKGELLKYLGKHFNTNSCYSELSAFFSENNIKSTRFSWT